MLKIAFAKQTLPKAINKTAKKLTNKEPIKLSTMREVTPKAIKIELNNIVLVNGVLVSLISERRMVNPPKPIVNPAKI